jgi:hypothetical protein
MAAEHGPLDVDWRSVWSWVCTALVIVTGAALVLSVALGGWR